LCQIFSWYPTSTGIRDLWDELHAKATSTLKLSGNWDGSLPAVTKSSNHSYDILFGHSWVMNTGDECYGKGAHPGNVGLVMKGYYWFGFFSMYTTLNLAQCMKCFIITTVIQILQLMLL